MGLGETLSLGTQLGTRTRDVTFGFTEPYFLDWPMQVGFTVFMQRFNYNQGREASILSGTNLIPLYNQLGSQNLLNYVSNSRGFTVFASYPLKRSFARLGLSYGYTVQDVTTLTDAAKQYYDYIDFLHINGPNALQGIRSSTIIPSFTYNSVNHPITPTGGKSHSERRERLPIPTSTTGCEATKIVALYESTALHLIELRIDGCPILKAN